MMSRFFFVASVTAWSALLPFAHADIVKTLDGQRHEGKLRLTNGTHFILRLQGGQETPIAFTNLLTAQLDPVVAATNTDTGLSSQWEMAQVNGSEASLNVHVLDNSISISETDGWLGRGEGDSKKGPSIDNCQFVYKRLQGPGSIVARVRCSNADTRGRAGLMWRQNLKPGSPFTLLARTERYQTQLLSRESERKPLQHSVLTERGIIGATWLKLVREGYAFAGYESVDGTNWNRLGEMAVLIPEEESALVGVAVADTGRENTNIFEQIAITAGPIDAHARVWSKGIVARTGSRLAGEIVSVGGDRVRLASGTLQRELGLSDAGWLVFKALSPAQQQMLNSAEPGALLFNGDFVEGEFQGLDQEQVKINSLLFGIRQYDVRAQVVAVVLRPLETLSRCWSVTLHDHSFLCSEKLSVDRDVLKLSDPVLGTIEVPWTQVLQIRRHRN